MLLGKVSVYLAIKKFAKAYDIKYLSVSNNSKARNTIKKSLEK